MMPKDKTKTLDAVWQAAPGTRMEIAKRAKVSNTTTLRSLRALVAMGQLQFTRAPGSPAHYTRGPVARPAYAPVKPGPKVTAQSPAPQSREAAYYGGHRAKRL